MKSEAHLVPQACFEVGQVYRKMGDGDEAKKWYKKARSYSGYITESLINFRVEYGLSLLRQPTSDCLKEKSCDINENC